VAKKVDRDPLFISFGFTVQLCGQATPHDFEIIGYSVVFVTHSCSEPAPTAGTTVVADPSGSSGPCGPGSNVGCFIPGHYLSQSEMNDFVGSNCLTFYLRVEYQYPGSSVSSILDTDPCLVSLDAVQDGEVSCASL
jgi:hypothetical protein